ncbi:MAG: radical SAM protein [Nitrospirota bacterium]
MPHYTNDLNGKTRMPVTNAFDFFIQLHLTERCNLRCAHCYQTGRRIDEMSFGEIRDIVRETSDMLESWKDSYGVEYSPSFNVTGGEPFLRKDLFAVLSEIKNAGFDVFLLTNGILIGPEEAKTLAGTGVGGVQISVEGPEKIHESIRGKGSFAGSMRGVSSLVDAGLRVTLNVTLSSVNADHFMDTVDLSLRSGAHRLGFSRLVPSGKGLGLLDRMLSAEEVRNLYRRIFALDTGNLKIVTGDPVASQYRYSDSVHDTGDVPSGGCAAGISGLTILPDGTVVPCRRLPTPIGNVRRDALREIWATSEVLEALRDKRRYHGKCGSCPRWSQCRGCRAIAYAFSQTKGNDDFLAEDPQCFIR